MNKVIIDSNIVFSALRKKESGTRSKILSNDYQFFAPNFLFGEIFKHKSRIMAYSKGDEVEIYEILLKILSRINFINEENISTGNFIEAYRLCKDVDEKDTPFVALSLELGYDIWTRDEELKSGLRIKGFDRFFEE